MYIFKGNLFSFPFFHNVNFDTLRNPKQFALRTRPLDEEPFDYKETPTLWKEKGPLVISNQLL